MWEISNARNTVAIYIYIYIGVDVKKPASAGPFAGGI